jgi:hypothetical protein
VSTHRPLIDIDWNRLHCLDNIIDSPGRSTAVNYMCGHQLNIFTPLVEWKARPGIALFNLLNIFYYQFDLQWFSSPRSSRPATRVQYFGHWLSSIGLLTVGIYLLARINSFKAPGFDIWPRIVFYHQYIMIYGEVLRSIAAEWVFLSMFSVAPYCVLIPVIKVMIFNEKSYKNHRKLYRRKRSP